MNLFESLDDLKPFIFRITDNGGATADRFTVITCDGDYFGASANPCHPQGVGMWGEGGDPVGYHADQVEKGEERDLRWIDLPQQVRDCVMTGLNTGFADWLERQDAHPSREAAGNYDGCWNPNGRDPHPIYRDGDKFRVKDSDRHYDGEPDNEFDTFREAVLYILPDDYTLAGPEYHTTVDLWDESGGPAPLWDRETDPPQPLDE